MALETIKSYLVSLGFSVDKGSYDQAGKAISGIESGLVRLAPKIIKTFGAAAAAVSAFGVALATTSAKFLSGLGNQEVQMEILSRQLWTTQQQAMAFDATLKSMGTNLQSLYLSPTLMKQYEQLHAVAMEMQTPGDYNQQIQMVQNLQLQFRQMRLEAYYALQWIGYYFIKYMNGPINNVNDVLTKINAVIVKQMPAWTKQAVQWLASFWQAGVFIVRAIGNVFNWLVKLGQYVPGWAKGIAAALAILSVSNPFMLMVEGLSAAILLLDDFQTYIHGGKAAFPELWTWVEKVTQSLQKMGLQKKIADDLRSSFEWLGSTFQNIAKFTMKMYSIFKANGTIKDFTGAVSSLGKALGDVFSALGNVITGVGHLFGLFNNSQGETGLQNFFQLLADLGIGAIKIVAGAIEELASMANMVGDMLHRKWGAAWQTFNDMLSHQNLANAGIISQQYVIGASGTSVGPPSYPYMFQNSGGSTSSTSNSSTNNTTVNAPMSITNHNYGNTSVSATTRAQSAHFNKLMHNLSGLLG